MLPWEDDGRDPARSLGRGGSGGGVPSVEGPVEGPVDGAVDWLCEDFRDAPLRITLSVGFVKSCCCTLSLLVGLLLASPREPPEPAAELEALSSEG